MAHYAAFIFVQLKTELINCSPISLKYSEQNGASTMVKCKKSTKIKAISFSLSAKMEVIFIYLTHYFLLFFMFFLSVFLSFICLNAILLGFGRKFGYRIATLRYLCSNEQEERKNTRNNIR
jgi:hypothetical protein